jgi:general secretion pathway protein A
MYQEFFGFREKPFSITPDPVFLYLSRIHKEAFAHLLFAVKDHTGFATMTGEVGTGKTTILRSLFTQLSEDTHRLAYLFNPSVSPDEILRLICQEFGLKYEGLSQAELFEELNRFLLKQNSDGRTVVLVIDEAQNLGREVLEQIRLISNLETEKEKLIQVILVGQPELERLLATPELRQLNQRVSVRFTLKALDYEDTCHYVRHRLKVAGYNGLCPFTHNAFRKLFRFSRGCPRLINILCDRALLIGYTRNSHKISGRMVGQAGRELGGGFFSRARLIHILPVAILVAAVFFGAGIFFGYLQFNLSLTHSSAQENPIRQKIKAPLPPPVQAQAEVEKPVKIDFSEELGSLQAALAEMSEKETAFAAFNALAEKWKVKPLVRTLSPEVSRSLVNVAYNRGLRIILFHDGPEALVNLNTPAILEMSLPGLTDKRFLAISALKGERFSIAPSFPGKDSIHMEELRSLWSGTALIYWRNYLDIPNIEDPGLNAREVGNLKKLLRSAGLSIGDMNTIYDRETVEAVTRFQGLRQIPQDGKVGPKTLLLLYQESADYNPVRLKQDEAVRGQP